ncbi:MAG TPA: luciferase family protein [Acidimicrobiales bacterium]|nr:luciferase family protein [Acidimicrobiales bacterium]
MPPLPRRRGPRPTTHTGLPHSQLDQQPDDPALVGDLASHAFGLPAVSEGRSAVSVPGARALLLDASSRQGPPEAFFAGGEFAHLHPAPDHSLHLCLPVARAEEACAAGWAEHHPLVATGQVPPTVVMVYAPRDAEELDVVKGLVDAAHRFASTAASMTS